MASPIQRMLEKYPFIEYDEEIKFLNEQKAYDAAYAFLPEKKRDAVCLAALFIGSIENISEKELGQDFDEIKEAYDRHEKTRFTSIKKEVAELLDSEIVYKRLINGNDSFINYSNTVNNETFWNVFTAASDVTTAVTTVTATNINTSSLNFIGTSLFYSDTVMSTFQNQYFTESWTPTILTTSPSQSRIVSTVEKPLAFLGRYAETQLIKSPSKNDRRILQRQMNLLESVIPSKDVKCFLSGDFITIVSEFTGIKYRFKLKENPTIKDLNKGGYHSTPYFLEIFDRNDRYLSNLCVFIRDTPVLDQLSAMIMYIRAGEEKMLLDRANHFSIGDIDSYNQVRQELGLRTHAIKSKGGNISRTMQVNDTPSILVSKSVNLIKEKYKNLATNYHLCKAFTPSKGLAFKTYDSLMLTA